MTCIFLCVLFSAKGQFYYADSLYNSSSFDDANLAYERIYFETENASIKQKALLKKAWTQKTQNDYAAAQQTLERIDIYSIESDSIKKLIQYELILTAYLANNFRQVDSYAKQFLINNTDSPYDIQMLLIQILALNELGEWNEAYKKAKVFEGLSQNDVQTDSIYAFKEKFKLKKVEKAKMLSTFLPGTGQLYAGYPVKAATSVTLHGASLAFGVFSVLDGYYLSGFLTGAGLLQAFYFGGIKHSGSLAERRNKKKIAKKSKGLKEHLIKSTKKKASN